MLPGATGEAVSVAHKATKAAVNVAESAKRGAATNLLTNQAVGLCLGRCVFFRKDNV